MTDSKKGRAPAKAQPVNEPAIRQDFAALDMAGEQLAKAQQLAQDFQYPGEVSVEALTFQAHALTRRTVEDFLQLGAVLILLKELVPHGAFERKYLAMGHTKITAWRAMRAAEKYRKSHSKQLLERAGNQTKLLELVLADDGIVETMHASGQFDDLELITASELRKRLRKAETERDRHKAVAEESHKDLVQERLKHKRLARIDYLDRYSVLVGHVTMAGAQMRKDIATFDAVRVAALQDEAEGEEAQADLERARVMLADAIVRVLRDVDVMVANFRHDFARTLGALATEEVEE